MNSLPEERNFSYSAWEDKRGYGELPQLNNNLPSPPDKYVPHRRSGIKKDGRPVDINRSKAIQLGRGLKRRKTNEAFFLNTVLPLIESKLNAAAWYDIAYSFPDDAIKKSLLIKGGFVKYVLGERFSWVHPKEEPMKVEQAIAMGAKIEN